MYTIETVSDATYPIIPIEVWLNLTTGELVLGIFSSKLPGMQFMHDGNWYEYLSNL